MSRAAEPGREPALDGLRGVAILLVLFFHGVAQVYTPAGHPAMDALKKLAGMGGSGVDLFFVLSGFLIGRNLLQHQAASNLHRVFYTRRACRILPAYLLLLASFLAARHVEALVSVGGPAFFNSAIPFWSYLVFLQNNLMAEARGIGPWWLVVTWSLAVEEQFYLLAPVLRRATVSTFFWLAGIVLLLSPLGRWWMVTEAANPVGAIYLTLLRFDSLLVGFLLAAWDQAGSTGRLLSCCKWVMGGCLLVVIGVVGPGSTFWPSAGERLGLVLAPSVAAVGFGALLWWVRARSASRPARLLSQPWLGWLGHHSYFIYLFHLPAMYTLHAVLRHRLPAHLEWSDTLITGAALVLTALLAVISRVLLELPFIRLGQRLQYST